MQDTKVLIKLQIKQNTFEPQYKVFLFLHFKNQPPIWTWTVEFAVWKLSLAWQIYFPDSSTLEFLNTNWYVSLTLTSSNFESFVSLKLFLVQYNWTGGFLCHFTVQFMLFLFFASNHISFSVSMVSWAAKKVVIRHDVMWHKMKYDLKMFTCLTRTGQTGFNPTRN